jgi:hypothetical protein
LRGLGGSTEFACRRNSAGWLRNGGSEFNSRRGYSRTGHRNTFCRCGHATTRHNTDYARCCVSEWNSQYDGTRIHVAQHYNPGDNDPGNFRPGQRYRSKHHDTKHHKSEHDHSEYDHAKYDHTKYDHAEHHNSEDNDQSWRFDKRFAVWNPTGLGKCIVGINSEHFEFLAHRREQQRTEFG